MEPQGDPEDRIRDLERPLMPDPYSSPYYAPPQHQVSGRSHRTAVWLVPLLVAGLVVAGAIVFFSLGPGGVAPAPTISGGGGRLDEPAAPQTPRPDPSPGAATRSGSAEAGDTLGIAGIGQSWTVTCRGGTVAVSGVDNTVEIRGSCAVVTVSGMDNAIDVEAAETIDASGFDNRVTYRAGDPETSTSGSGNVIERG